MLISPCQARFPGPDGRCSSRSLPASSHRCAPLYNLQCTLQREEYRCSGMEWPSACRLVPRSYRRRAPALRRRRPKRDGSDDPRQLRGREAATRVGDRESWVDRQSRIQSGRNAGAHGERLGAATRIYLRAEVLEFCSATLSRQPMEADAKLLAVPSRNRDLHSPRRSGQCPRRVLPPAIGGNGCCADLAAG